MSVDTQPASAQVADGATGTAAPDEQIAVEERPGLGTGFAQHLTSTGLANLGDGVFQTGMPLVALSLTRSPAQIALLAAASWLPWLLGGLAAGVLVDRHDRRITRATALGSRAALLAAALALVVTGHMTMPLLVTVALLYGVAEVFTDLSGTSLVPDLVPRSKLQAANGRLIAVETVANAFLGAPVAGFVLALGAGWVFGIPAALAVGAAFLALRIRGSFKHAPDEGGPRPSTQVREGLRFVWRHDVIRPLTIAGGLMNMASTGYFAVFVVWAVGEGSRLGMSEQAWALAMAMFALGAVAGSLLTSPVLKVLPELPVMFGGWLSGGVLMLVPVLRPSVPLWFVVVFLMGLTNTIGNVLTQSLRQRVVPTAMLGRVTGASRTIGYGLMPVGAVLGGVVAENWGLPTTFVGASLIAIAAALYPTLVVKRATIEAAEAAVAPAVSPAAGA